MFGLGFGSGGGEAGDDSDKENKSDSPSPPPSNRPPPWLKKFKVSEKSEDLLPDGTGHHKLVSNIRFVKICQ